MRRLAAFLMLALVMLAGLCDPCKAAPESVIDPKVQPYVGDRRPFSLEANYMSLPGYLRFVVYQREGIWMDRREAEAIVKSQIATGE
ncbi:MAG: hypothetical protein EB084_17095 [Proteobacteria bacterium]|nr:hypothetical protein [Pseudomonadota bacterium]